MARRLPHRRRRRALCRTGHLPRARAERAGGARERDLRRTRAQRRRDGHLLHLHRHGRQWPADPRRHRRFDEARHADVSVPAAGEPGPARAAGAPLVLAAPEVQLELDHIQSGALHERPSPYVGRYLLLRIDDRAAGRELVRRLHAVVDASRHPNEARDAWATVAFTYNGLKRLGVPEVSLDSFAPEFREGMAARAAEIGDVGASAPANWEAPLGTADVHVAISVISPSSDRLEAVAARARRAHEQLPGVEVIWRQECYQPAPRGTSVRFQGRVRQPAIRGR